MNKLKYFLLIFILLLVPKTFCTEFNMNAYTSATLGGTKNRYRGTEIDITGSANTYTFGTQYNGRLSVIETYFDYPFAENLTYRLTYNMNTDDFRNNFGARYWWDCSQTMNATNQHVGTLTYVSYKKVQFTFTPTESTNCIRVMIGSSNVSTGAITGVSNWRLNNITIYDPDFQSGGSGQGTSTPTPTPVSTPNATNQDIINNNNENTQDIINNNNENITCPVGPLVIDSGTFSDQLGILTDDGSINTNVSITLSVSKYFVVKPKTEYTLTYANGIYSGSYYCLYTNAKSLIACYRHDNDHLTFTTTNTTNYVRFTLNGNRPLTLSGPVCNNWEQEGIKAINDTLTDDSEPSINFIDVEVSTNTPVSDLILLPLTILNKLVDTIDENTCSNYILPFDFFGGNNTLTFPCFTIGDYLGNYASVIDGMICIFMIYEIAMLCVSIFDDITSLRDGFSGLYQPKHGPGTYRGRHSGNWDGGND